MKEKKRHRGGRGTVLALAFATAALVPFVVVGSEKPDFSGSWQLNQDESDDPREKMREAMERGGGFRGPGGGGIGGPGGRIGGRGRGGMRGPGGGGPERGPGGGEREGPGRGPGAMSLIANAERLTIEHRDPDFTVYDASGQPRFLHADGREVMKDGENGEKLNVRTRWKDDRIVVETKMGRGKLSETYQLGEGGKRMVVTVEIERGRGPALSFKRVYDSGSASSDERAERAH